MTNLGRLKSTSALLLGWVVACAGCSRKTPDPEITIAAATSLRKTLPVLLDGFVTAHPGATPTATYQSSGEIARQVEGGAGIDVVILAAKDPLDRLIQGGHVDASSACVVATNQLVLIGPAKGSKPGAAPLTFQTLKDLPVGERLAMGDPASVPAGTYAKKALEALGIWKDLQDRVVFAGNVAAVLAYATRGEAALAIVYRTEIEGADGIVQLDVAKGNWAPVPEVWGAITTKTQARKRAEQILHFIQSPDGQSVLGQFGFGPPHFPGKNLNEPDKR